MTLFLPLKMAAVILKNLPITISHTHDTYICHVQGHNSMVAGRGIPKRAPDARYLNLVGQYPNTVSPPLNLVGSLPKLVGPSPNLAGQYPNLVRVLEPRWGVP